MGKRINPRALEVACRAALESGPDMRQWEEMDDAAHKRVLAQGAVLLRAYDEAKAIDLRQRRGAAEPATGDAFALD